MLRVTLLLLLSAPLLAGDDSISIPFQHLKLKGTLKEGHRGLGDIFPYIAIGRADLTPKSLRADVDSAGAALEAVRLFAAGPLVRDEATAKKMIETGSALKKKLKHLRVNVTAHRPESYAPTAERTKDGWKVSFVAFEMDRMLGLVHFVATVSAEGQVQLTRKPIVDGPMTSWQTAMISTATAEQQEAAIRRAREMREEAVVARRVYAKALAPPCDLDTAWALARLRLSAADLEDLWGPHDRVVGSGVYLVARDLKGGGAITYDAGDKKRAILRMSHVREAPAPMRVGPTLHTLSRR